MALLYFKKSKCKFLQHSYVTIVYLKHTKERTWTVTENCVLSCFGQHLASPSTFLVTHSKAKAITTRCKLTSKPLVTSPHLPDHRLRCHQHNKAVSQLLGCTQRTKSIPKANKHHQNIFTLLKLHQPPSLF